LDELEDDMARYKCKYYCEGDPEVTDTQYDRYEEVLKRERPDSWVLASVGCPICFKEGK
jgi:NAD-dependent DNA ligase